ncbi:unnamed protein product [Ectocarpus sp. CCAP 1310/34]|nr:unnamed protein product [Ectocarpus sp. CCAP 1310/34]
MMEPRRRHGEVSCWKKKKITVVVDDARTAAWRERWHNSQVIMSNPVLDQAFEKHAQDYLCSESYDFIQEVGCYVALAEQNPAEDRFAHFTNIVNVYISAGSKLEINIGTAMRTGVLERKARDNSTLFHDMCTSPNRSWFAKIGDRVRFLEATFERQRDVFNPPRMEISKMIDENLVHSFWTRQLFLDACKKWEEQQGAGAGVLADEENPFTGA